MAFNESRNLQTAVEVLSKQLEQVQQEKRDLLDRLMAVFTQQGFQQYAIGRVDENFIPPQTSSLYDDPDDEDYKIGNVIRDETQ